MGTVRRRLGALVSAAAAGAALLAAPSVASAGSTAPTGSPTTTSHARAATVTGYAVSLPVCPRPRPGVFTCMAYRRTEVAKGTPGARRYTLPRWAQGPAGGYTPAAIAKAYGINPNGGAHQTVAIVDWDNDPNVRRDLNSFDRHYRLPTETASSFRVVNQDGRSAPLPRNDRGAAVEIALDVQAVRAVCHKCHILLVEASGATSADIARAENTAVRLGAGVVSNSFGQPERRGHPVARSLVKAFNHPGVVITASSGDNGYFFWDVANEYVKPPETASFPATASTVVSVGGTSLSMTSGGSRANETVWNGNGTFDAKGLSNGQSNGASGGGCSAQFGAPYWQRSVWAYKSSGCAGKRLSVDVSAVGDPATGFDIFDSYGSGGWATIGGTSLSSPLVAGMWALAGGARGMSAPAHALYQNYALRKSALHDVTAGGNGWCGGGTYARCADASLKASDHYRNPNKFFAAMVDCSFTRSGAVAAGEHPLSPQCNAIKGYDGATGVGTPNGLNLFRTTTPKVSFTVSSTRKVHRWISVRLHVYKSVANSYTSRRTWTWGDGSRTVASSASSGHRYGKRGTYTMKVTVVDSLGQTVTSSQRITVS